MCSLHTLTKDSFEKNRDAWLDMLDNEAPLQPDGYSILFIDEGGKHTVVRSLDWTTTRVMLDYTSWTRCFIHMRKKTGVSDVVLENTHFWNEGSLWYCHNGSYFGEEAMSLEVDSKIIGEKLLDHGPYGALQFCQGEERSNVFVIDTDSGEWFFSRSAHNTVYTDGAGQFSTAEVPDLVDTEVPHYSIFKFTIEIQKEEYTVFDRFATGSFVDWKEEL